MRNLTTLLLPLLLALLAGCSSTKVFSNVDPNADFGRYATYGFHETLGTDSQSYQDIATQFMRDAVARELEARGYTRSKEPDLVVNFHITTEEKLQTTTTPTGYYGYRGFGGYGTWGGYAGYETTVSQYTQGTVQVDLIDRARNQLVWEGAVVQRVTDKKRRELQKTLDRSVEKIFERYPFRAAF